MRISHPFFPLLLAISMLSAGFPISAQSEPTTPTTGIKAAPVEAYAALPDARNAHLSPNGKLLALISPIKGRFALVVWDLDGENKMHVISTGEFEPVWVAWKSDHRLLVATRFYSMRDPLNSTFDTRLIALDADGSNMVSLVRSDQFGNHTPQMQDKVVSFLPGDENHILLELPPKQGGSLIGRMKYPEVIRVDVNTGQATTLAQQHDKVISWRSDAAGNVRLGLAREGKIQNYQVRSLADDSWRTIQSFEINKGRIFSPVAFVEGKPDHLYAISNHEGKAAALYELDVPSDSFIRTVAASAKGFVHPIEKDGRLLGYQEENEPPVYLDASYAQEAKLINRALPDSHNEILDRSVDGKRILVLVTKGNEPSSYWLLDRRGEKTDISEIAPNYPDLKPAQIASTSKFSYKARDGLDIPALLTLPPGYVSSPGKSSPPFVVLPHGGPTSRDPVGFDYLVQFLASRGYGVLQPQFRGSTGNGAAFEAAGHQQWGLAMQDDITDGTRWLVAQKLADPARIAIVGASYGGYAALMGAVKEPDLYHCAVAIAPVTDLELLIERINNSIFGDANIPRIGSDSAVLEKTSPARNVDRIHIPLLLVHGRKDYTVPVAHTEKMAEALKKAGKPVEVIYLDEADHFLSHGDDRLTALKALEKFLTSNLTP
jgi:dipeptidyl aminopeptidase/acylaminoacyl peptidase